MSSSFTTSLLSPLTHYSGPQVRFPADDKVYHQSAPWNYAVPTFSLTKPGSGLLMSSSPCYVDKMGRKCCFSETGVTCSQPLTAVSLSQFTKPDDSRAFV